MYAKYVPHAMQCIHNSNQSVGMGVWFSTILANISRILFYFSWLDLLWIISCQTLVGCVIDVQFSN